MRTAPRALFAGTLLLAAGLMFWLELVGGRLLLPLLGGAPAVWNTCLFFFQGGLLGGYLLAHALTRWAPARAQVALQALLLGLGGLALPLGLAAYDPGEVPPALRVLLLLALSCGGPFLALSTTAPLLQSWYARLGQPDSHDPYSLYAASNLGSLLGLLACPLLLDPALALGAQGRVWSGAYALLALLTLGAGALLWRAAPAGSASPALTPAPAAPSGRQRARWLWGAFVPAGLLHGATATITRDMAPVPLLWALPLALYLLSFVLAFARRERVPRWLLAATVPLLLAGMLLTLLVRWPWPVWVELPLHALGLFAASWLLHRDLAAARPHPAGLTGYYLWIAAGGLLAGLLCGLLAPLLLRDALEYPLLLLLAALLVPAHADAAPQDVGGKAARRALGAAFGLLLPLLAVGFSPGALLPGLPALLLLVPLASALGWAFPHGRRRATAALALGTGLVLCDLGAPLGAAPLLRARSFFGLHRVVREEDGLVHYVSGRITHGSQDPARPREPISYYHRQGPIGQAMSGWSHTARPGARVAVIGLGAGSLAAYARPGQVWRFYELDPQVVAIARDPRFFSYLADAPTPPEVVPGDARLSLAREAAAGEARWDLLVLDAFNSDSIPVHLLTREAFALYLERLAPEGALVLNVSNHFLALERVVARVADAHGLVGWQRRQDTLTPEEKQAGCARNHCLVLARSPAALSFLGPARAAWEPLAQVPRARLWTDAHVDLPGVLELR